MASFFEDLINIRDELTQVKGLALARMQQIAQLEAENKKLRLALFDYANEQHTGSHASERARLDVMRVLQERGIEYKHRSAIEPE